MPTNLSSLGVVVRDEVRSGIGSSSQSRICSSSEHAEAEAILEDVKAAQHMNIKHAIMESDCKRLIDTLNLRHDSGDWRILPVLIDDNSPRNIYLNVVGELDRARPPEED